MDPASDILCHGPSNTLAACQLLAQTLAERLGKRSLKLGLFVRVSCGLHEHTRLYADTTKLLASLLREQFPGSPFLAMATLWDPDFSLHRDQQNDRLPNLVIELQSSPPGGTWIENPEGNAALEVPTGDLVWGTILRGASKISARAVRHGSVRGRTPRHVLVAWTPSGWRNTPSATMEVLRALGFVLPTVEDSRRAQLSTWRGSALIQRPIRFSSAARRGTSSTPGSDVWPKGVLQGDSGVILDYPESD